MQPCLRPIAFVLSSTNHGTMLVNRHDYRIVGDGGYGVGFQLLNTSSFDQDEVNLCLQLLETRRQSFGASVVAIDCGSNIGVHTVSWAKLMHNWGEVLSFEAQERIFYALAGNITINNCFNAKAIWAAVGSKSGTMLAPNPNYFVPSSFGSLELKKSINTEFIGQEVDYSEAQSTTIKVVAIDDLSLERLDFIKIDIEGMEMEALNGAKKSIEKLKPQILVERIKGNENDIKEFLEKFGYKILPLGINFLAIHTCDPALNLIEVTP